MIQYPEYHKGVATYVEEQLKKSGFEDEQITTKWQNAYQETSMRIDPSTGEVEYGIEDDDLNSSQKDDDL